MPDTVDVSSSTYGWLIALAVIGTILMAGVAWVFLPTTNIGYGFAEGFRGFFFAIANFIPLGFMLFGMIADIINQEFRNTIATILGMIAVLLNNLVSRLLTIGSVPMAGGAVPDQVWCTIPGLNALESRAFPMTITSTWAIMMYYITFAAAKRPASQNISLGVGLGGLSLLQILTFMFVGCKDYFIPLGGSYAFNVLGAIVLGTTIGTSAYGVVNNYYPAYSPIGFAPPMVPDVTIRAEHWVGPGGTEIPRYGPGGKRPLFGGTTTGGSCSAVEGGDEDAMVCEAYKNGQLVTDTLA